MNVANNKTRWEKADPPNTLLAIDPGASYPKSKVPYAGAALFQWGELCWAALVKCPTMVDSKPVAPFARPNTLVRTVCEAAHIARHGCGKPRKNSRDLRTTAEVLGEGITVLVVEQPRIYRNGPARPEDIVALMGIYGAFMGGIDAEFYSGPGPSEWKGSIEKTIMNERVLRVLNSSERLLLMRAQQAGDGGLSDHVIDGVGLGLFTIGRMGAAGVL